MGRHFQNRRVKDRIHSAPDILTPQEVEFYLGVNGRTVRGWLKLWQETEFPIANLQGDRWSINKDRMVDWLIMTERVTFSPEYGYPTPEQAQKNFEKSMGLAPLPPEKKTRLRLVPPSQ